MKTLVVYYSYGGTTKALAQGVAKKAGATIYEIKDQKKPGKVGAYALGSFKAMRMKPGKVEPVTARFANFDRIIVMGPVWAGHPAPAVVSVLDMLPSGKDVEVRMVSMSGASRAKDKVEAKVREKGCKLVAYEDIKAK